MAPLLESTREFQVVPFPAIPGYEVLQELGRGGMGVVYKARQQKLARLVALKALLPELIGSKEKLTRFRTEAKAVARLQHPNIVQIFDVGEAEGTPYFSLELVEGGSLADHLGRPWPILEALQFVERLARAIHYAHERDIVHRDLKPANILLGRKSETRNPKSEHVHETISDFEFRLSDFEPKVTDFSLARLLDESSDPQAWHTQLGAILGTPPYMAPEQAAGRIHDIGPATDIHALGMILYEMLTGRPPFQGSSLLEILEQIKSQTPLSPSEIQRGVDRALDAICLRCLEKEPKRRYASAAALADDLNKYRSLKTRAKNRVRRPTIVALQTLLAIVSAVGSGLTVWQVFRAEHENRQRESSSAETSSEADRQRASATSKQATIKTAAGQALDQGLLCCNQGDVDQGMRWFARILQEAGSQDSALQHLARENLANWRGQLNALQVKADHPGSVEMVGFRAEGQVFYTVCQVRSSAADQHAEVRLWNSATGEQVGKSIEQKGSVTAASLSPDGQTLIVASGDSATLWNAITGQPIGQPMRHAGPITCVRFSLDSKLVLTGSAEPTVRWWNAQTSQAIGSPLQHRGVVTAGAFSPDGALAATASDSSVYLWTTRPAIAFKLQLGNEGGAGVGSLAFSPNGHILATGSNDGTTRLWDTATGRAIGQPLMHKDRVQSVAFSPDGLFVATGSADRTVRLWEIPTGKALGLPMEHPSAVRTMQMSGDGQVLLATCADFSAHLWEIATGKRIGKPLWQTEKVTAAVLSPDGRHVLTGSQEGTAKIWEIGNGLTLPAILHHQGRISAIHFSPDGQTLLTSSWDCTARLWDAKTLAPIGSSLQHNSMILSSALSADGQKLITGGGALDKTARIWDGHSGRPICPPLAHPCAVTAVAFTPNGNVGVTVGADHAVRLWNANTGMPLKPPFLHPADLRVFAISPDSKTILTACADSRARLWNVEQGTLRRDPFPHPGPVLAAAFSPNGQQFVTGCHDGKGRLWETATGKLIAEFSHDREVLIVGFSPDGRFVLTGSRDRTARVWNASSGQAASPPLSHSSLIVAAAFSPDSSMVAVGDESGTCRLWDVATGKPVGPAMQSGSAISALSFAPNGRMVATGDVQGAVRLWSVHEPVKGDVDRIASWVEHLTDSQPPSVHLSPPQVAVSSR